MSGLEMPLPGVTKVFTYNIQRRGETWAELKVIGDGLVSSNVPAFVEGSRIGGKVRLYATRSETIHSVIVSVKGQVITGVHSSDNLTFMEVSQMVWPNITGESGSSNPRSSAKSFLLIPADKLQGTYTWPFCLELPREVAVASKATKASPRVYKLPEAFFERHGRASVRYEICVRFVRSHFRPDDRIHAACNYIPWTSPGPPSLLRQLAYERDSPLLGPRDDPEGWHDCGAITLNGHVHRRDVEISCSLSLAKPLAYTRGSVIPCWLTLQSQDAEALDFTAVPKAVVMRLRRCVKAAADQTRSVENTSWRDHTELSELGIWWSAGESVHTRELSGELHLKADLTPSSAMAHFRVEYNIVLFPFDTINFKAMDTGPLVEQSVEIMTGYAPGPRPRMYTPPEYESPDSVVVAPGFG